MRYAYLFNIQSLPGCVFRNDLFCCYEKKVRRCTHVNTIPQTNKGDNSIWSYSRLVNKKPSGNFTLRAAPSFLDPIYFNMLAPRLIYYKGRSSDFRIILLSTPSRCALTKQWHSVDFVPDYSGGTMMASHHLPF